VFVQILPVFSEKEIEPAPAYRNLCLNDPGPFQGWKQLPFNKMLCHLVCGVGMEKDGASFPPMGTCNHQVDIIGLNACSSNFDLDFFFLCLLGFGKRDS